MSQIFDRTKLISNAKNNEYVLAIKNSDAPYYSYFKGDGQSFSVLHGTHDIKKLDDGYYNFYNNKPKKIGNLKDSILIKKSVFWSMADFDALDTDFINNLRGYRNENIEPSILLSKSGIGISILFEDIIQREAHKKNYLI